MKSSCRFLGASLVFALAAALTSSAIADPQAAGMLAPMNETASKGQAPAAVPATPAPGQSNAKTPKKPESPADTSFMAPPIPGYAIMFLLGAAVVTLNLWSSKRTQLD